MKSYAYNKDFNLFKKEKPDFSLHSINYQKIPPIIGIITADQHGNTIFIIEHSRDIKDKYGPIISYLKEDDKSLMELDLISMYFSSFKSFAGQTNIKNLSHLEIHGSNIKVQIYFLFERYMVITFLNASTQLNPLERTTITDYFTNKFLKFEEAFVNFNNPQSRKILKMLEVRGRSWLKKINKEYIQRESKAYFKRDELIGSLVEQISPIIEEELNEYLEKVPEELIINLLKEIKNKIHDKLFKLK
ncbi:MAG: hypothetical protein JW891_03805 [Candidatus Lokiarchaeota archaeon]|nr:hypothetical protein [Candidatus Lokiarchaeota archaeon]